jgi:hypothetical protein
MPKPRWKHLDRTRPIAPDLLARPEPVPGSTPEAEKPDLAGAAAFLQGQQALRSDPLLAARCFGEALERFRSLRAPGVRAEMLTASYIAQAIAFLAGGALDAAQLSYSRLREEQLPPAAVEFARGLFELAGELRGLEEAERREAVSELISLVEGLQPDAGLDIRFWGW